MSRSRCTCISMLILIASILVTIPVIKFHVAPESNVTPMLDSFNKVDVYNARLSHLESKLLPISNLVGESVPLRYVGNQDYFVYFQATLAPRRVSPDYNSNYLLIHALPGESIKTIDVRYNARLIALLADDLGLFQVIGSK